MDFVLQYDGEPPTIAAVGHAPFGSESHDATGNSRKPSVSSEVQAKLKSLILRIGPLIGLLCLLLALSSILASFLVLFTSNGMSTARWSIKPSVYLGIATAVANQAMRYACVQGVIVCWWTRAMKGASIAKLHQDWHAGTTIWGAIYAYRRLSLLGLACIFSSLVAVDGPLLQSASSIVSVPIVNEYQPLQVRISPEVPTGFTGSWARVNMQVDGVCDNILGLFMPSPNGSVANDICTGESTDMDNVGRSLLTGQPLNDIVSGCTGTCSATVKAPALSITACSSKLIPVNFSQEWNATLLYTQRDMRRTSLIVAVMPLMGEKESLNLISGYATMDGDCAGTFNLTTCQLDSAIGLYDVTVTDDTVELATPIKPTILAVANNTQLLPADPKTDIHNGTLVGVSSIFESQSAIVVQWLESSLNTFSTGGSAYLKYWTDRGGHCPTTLNPFDNTLAGLNEMMFRVGAVAADTYNNSALEGRLDAGLSIDSEVTGTVQGNHNVFETNFWFFFGAALMELISIMCILPTYWGWWKLDRPVSFSPIEIAKAFDSPLLEKCHTSLTAREIAKTSGDRVIRYGFVSPSDGPSEATSNRMAFADTANIRPPLRTHSSLRLPFQTLARTNTV